jgi:cysteine desulfurase
MAEDASRIAALRDRLLNRLMRGIPGIIVNASRDHRIAGNLNLTFPATPAMELMRAAPDLCVSTGSACSSAEVEPSYVLRALGLDEGAAARTLRIGIGRFTSAADIDAAAAMLIEANRIAAPARAEARIA